MLASVLYPWPTRRRRLPSKESLRKKLECVDAALAQWDAHDRDQSAQHPKVGRQTLWVVRDILEGELEREEDWRMPGPNYP